MFQTLTVSVGSLTIVVNLSIAKDLSCATQMLRGDPHDVPAVPE